jgi:hypothetical protein
MLIDGRLTGRRHEGDRFTYNLTTKKKTGATSGKTNKPTMIASPNRRYLFITIALASSPDTFCSATVAAF